MHPDRYDQNSTYFHRKRFLLRFRLPMCGFQGFVHMCRIVCPILIRGKLAGGSSRFYPFRRYVVGETPFCRLKNLDIVAWSAKQSRSAISWIDKSLSSSSLMISPVSIRLIASEADCPEIRRTTRFRYCGVIAVKRRSLPNDFRWHILEASAWNGKRDSVSDLVLDLSIELSLCVDMCRPHRAKTSRKHFSTSHLESGAKHSVIRHWWKIDDSDRLSDPIRRSPIPGFLSFPSYMRMGKGGCS